MNPSIFIILIPALLVAAGYIVVLRLMGIAPGYPRLAVATVMNIRPCGWNFFRYSPVLAFFPDRRDSL